MTTPEEAKSGVEAAWMEYIEEVNYRSGGIAEWEYDIAKKAFAAGVKYVADLNQEKIAQLTKEV